MTDPSLPPDSLLRHLDEANWDPDDQPSIDAAEDVLGALESHALNQVEAENTKPEPDQSVIDHWQDIADECRSQFSNLLTLDDAKRVFITYGPKLREVLKQ